MTLPIVIFEPQHPQRAEHQPTSLLVVPSPSSSSPAAAAAARSRSIGASGGRSRSDPALTSAALDEDEDQPMFVNWRSPLRQPIDIIQTQIMREKARKIRQDVDDLEKLTTKISEADDLYLPSDGPDEEAFIGLTIKIKDDLDGLYELVDLILKDRLSAKQEQILHEIRHCAFNPALDISVRFLGLDWRQTDRLTASLITHVGAVCDRVLNSGRAEFVTTTHLLRDLNKMSEDLISHADCVLRGRLNRRHNALISEQQTRHRKFLERLREEQKAELSTSSSPKEAASSRLRRIKKFFQQNLLAALSSSSSTTDNNGEVKKYEENEGQKSTAAASRQQLEEEGLLWSSWFESVYCYSQIAERVNNMGLSSKSCSMLQ